jgi:hypothetical protein
LAFATHERLVVRFDTHLTVLNFNCARCEMLVQSVLGHSLGHCGTRAKVVAAAAGFPTCRFGKFLLPLTKQADAPWSALQNNLSRLPRRRSKTQCTIEIRSLQAAMRKIPPKCQIIFEERKIRSERFEGAASKRREKNVRMFGVMLRHWLAVEGEVARVIRAMIFGSWCARSISRAEQRG